jgi:hypothetical protein
LFVIHRPVSPWGHEMTEEWQLRCSRCGKRFRTLTECFFSYEMPALGARSPATCCHRTCAAGEGQVRLMRADFALRRVLEALMKPAIAAAALEDLPRRINRPWCNP